MPTLSNNVINSVYRKGNQFSEDLSQVSVLIFIEKTD